ncbi:MAG: hypothetical protein ACLPKB_33895 [Xanthobacteraceae bacterium]
MSRHPINVLAKPAQERRIEIGGTTAVAEAFLPHTTASIRIGEMRKRGPLRSGQPPSTKRRGSRT